MFSRVFRSAVAWSFVATSLKLGSAILILPLILRRVSADELGLWYVFLSFGALAMLIDFGFGHTINRAVAYLWAGARELAPYGLGMRETEKCLEETSLCNSEPNRPLLSRLIGALKFYYAALGIFALTLLLVAGGWWVCLKTQNLPNATALRIAFVVYSFGIALNLVGAIWLYALNGVNRVRESLQLNVLCLVANYIIIIVGLLAGFRLWALVIGTFVMGITERSLGRIVFTKLVPLEKTRFDSRIIKVLWPNAWRTGAVAIGGYFVLQANTLICSGFLGLKTTASWGLSLQAVTFLVGVSSVWVIVKIPFLNQLRVQGRLRELTVLFRQRVALSILTYILGAIALLLFGESLLGFLHTKTQFLPNVMLLTLLVIFFLEMHHCLYAALVFSENVNPFVLPALVSGSAIVMLSIFLTPRIGIWGMLLAQGCVQLSFQNWWVVKRAIQGLGVGAGDYWLGFLGQTGLSPEKILLEPK